MNKIHLSIVSPVYKAENIITELVFQIIRHVSEITSQFEIILVDDGSPDNSWGKIENECKRDKRVKGIKLSRNFGQHPAIMAGISEAMGDYLVIMDCDLQDQPSEIKKLYSKIHEGYEIVLARRTDRRDSWVKKLYSKFFSISYSYFTGMKFDNAVANFGIYSKKVIDEVLKMEDYIKSFPLFVNWVGFKKTYINVDHAERKSGKSSYTFRKSLSLAVNTIISFSNKPLKLFVKFGILLSIVSFLFGIFILYKYLTGQITVIGYSSLIISIWFLSGVLMTTVGVVGIYIGKIFNQTKNRQSFIIEKRKNYE